GRYTPVLHLHGKVGWLRRPDETTIPFFSGTTAYDPTFGLPIIMLPDPRKTYSGDDVLSILWAQFENALHRARRVFVVGHSLADDSGGLNVDCHQSLSSVPLNICGGGDEWGRHIGDLG